MGDERKPDPQFDAALLQAAGGRLDRLGPTDRRDVFEALRRQKINELRIAVQRFGVELADEDADFIIGRLLEPSEEHYLELIKKFPELTTYFNRVLKRRA